MKSKQEQLNRTGIYLRLSKDDERAGESLSIENQRKIVTKYVQEQGWKIIDEYIDDGYSGTNFDRPDVQRLLDDAKMGKINTIVVKDLSRFGRNYIQVGQYTDYIFPTYGIRFVAISDNVDTEDKNSTGMDMMPIMNVFNEWHCANTSKKIRAVKMSSAKDGKYGSSIAAYGYIAGDDEKRIPIVDEEAAEVVRRIFNMRASGMGYRKIAATLTIEGVMSPSDYRAKRYGKEHYGIANDNHRWNGAVVKNMLANPIYIGNLAQLRQTTVSYKNKKHVTRNEKEWIVVENTHEPIISQELWQKCKEISEEHYIPKGIKSGIVLPLSGMLYCPDCGGKIKYGWTDNKRKNGKVNRVCFYNCGTYTRVGKYACSSHFIGHNELESIILNDIHSKAKLVVEDEERERKEFLEQKEQLTSTKLNSDKKNLKTTQRRIEELDRMIRSVYEDKVNGKVPEEICVELLEKYLNEKKELSAKIIELEKSVLEQKQNFSDVDEFIRRLKRYARAEELTREMCLELIECVTIGAYSKDKSQARKIHIYYKFMDKGYAEKLQNK